MTKKSNKKANTKQAVIEQVETEAVTNDLPELDKQQLAIESTFKAFIQKVADSENTAINQRLDLLQRVSLTLFHLRRHGHNLNESVKTLKDDFFSVLASNSTLTAPLKEIAACCSSDFGELLTQVELTGAYDETAIQECWDKGIISYYNSLSVHGFDKEKPTWRGLTEARKQRKSKNPNGKNAKDPNKADAENDSSGADNEAPVIADVTTLLKETDQTLESVAYDYLDACREKGVLPFHHEQDVTATMSDAIFDKLYKRLGSYMQMYLEEVRAELKESNETPQSSEQAIQEAAEKAA